MHINPLTDFLNHAVELTLTVEKPYEKKICP
uniref:Uncharacterized protein n=1 Tax=Anguilla anguilla TaxID=7936 RepID=A0A0E9U353_ANGAN